MMNVIRHSNGNYTVIVPGCDPYGVVSGDDTGRWTIADIDAYLAEHPDALIPEPLPPEPTPEERAAQRRAAIIAELNALDAQAVQYIRATMEGTIDKEGTKRYKANKKRVKELKAELQTLK